ncbi:hypothetical protein AB3S75_039843 [Citrus x aurantiifolia]
MCLGNNPYQCSDFWDEDENLVHFKYPLPPRTKREDVNVEIDEDGKLLIEISEGASSHSDPLSSASPWMIVSGFSSLSLLKKKEGDTTSPINPMKFNLPAGLNTNGFKTAIDDEGLLTLTFKKLVPIHSETPSDLKNVLVKWKNKKGVFRFKAYLPAGLKMEDMMVGIEGRKSLMIGIRDLPKKEEGDTSTLMCSNGKTFRSFIFPDGVNPNGFKTAMDDAGVLTVTFTKLKPEKKKLGPVAKKTLGCLAQAVIAAGVLICDKISEAICSGGY